jgi:hypothetical protein
MTKYTSYLHGMVNRFKFQDVKSGDIIEVPDWYYEGNKERHVSQGVSFDHYTDKHGNRTPFKTEEAVRHGDMTDPAQTMKKVKLFDLVIEDGRKNNGRVGL